VWKAHGNSQGLNCTAQDVTLSSAKNIDIVNGGSCQIENGVRVCRCNAGGNVTFNADFQMDLTADTRYDIGFYIATDGDPNGDGAVTGLCTAIAATATNAPVTFRNLDADPGKSFQAGDVCGDITGAFGTAFNPQLVKGQITTQCKAGPSGKLELPFCTTWRQPGSNEVCKGTGTSAATNDVFPGSPSKCNCGTLVVDIFTETATLEVTKTALPPGTVPETGGSASYSVTVKNLATVATLTLNSLTDDKYGDITASHAANTSCTGSATPGVCQAVTATNCTLPAQPLAAQATFSCQFTGTVPPGDFPGSFTDVAKA